jgi:hypothetical protein
MSEEDVLRRAVEYAAITAEERWKALSAMAPLATLAALTEGLGKLAFVATESLRSENCDEYGKLRGGELFEQACQSAVVVMLESIILLHMWGIDGRIVIKAFLDHEMKMKAKNTRKGVRYLQLVKRGEN